MNRAVRHESFLAWRNFRHLKWACVLSILSVGLYLGFDFPAGHNGGTWLGYTLGTIGALLIVWLMWFGIRKRRYGPGNWSLKGWLSAHVYLGLSLVIVGTLHTGFQLGWNIHGLAYILMLIVIASGAIGLLVYVRVPQLMTENRRSQSLDEMARAIVEIDGEAAKAADLYQIALGKPGVDTAQVLTRLGIAQVDSGNYAGAQATFAKVSGARKPIAELWSAYAAQKAGGA